MIVHQSRRSGFEVADVGILGHLARLRRWHTDGKRFTCSLVVVTVPLRAKRRHLVRRLALSVPQQHESEIES